jgi:NDP-sugar pyrophosphorylase family protein
MPEVITRHFGDGKNFGISVTYVHEEVPLGTGGALGLLPKNIGNLPLIVINGDILTDLDFTELIDFHSRANVDATMCLREVETAVAYGVVSVDRSRVSGMVEKPVYRHLINTGIYVLSHECVNAVEQGVNIDLPTLLEKRMKKDYEVGAYKFFGKWIDIGKMEDYSRAQEEVLNNE